MERHTPKVEVEGHNGRGSQSTFFGRAQFISGEEVLFPESMKIVGNLVCIARARAMVGPGLATPLGRIGSVQPFMRSVLYIPS